MPWYVCKKCGAMCYSAANLEHLRNPFCNCGEKLEVEENEDWKGDDDAG